MKMSIDDVLELARYMEDGFRPPWPQQFSEWHPKLRNKICTCSGRIYGNHPYGFKWPDPGMQATCKKCNKPGYWQLKFCHVCYEFFVKCFYHPAYNGHFAICYDCLEETTPDKVNPMLTPFELSRGKKPPTDPRYRVTLEFVEVDFNIVPSF